MESVNSRLESNKERKVPRRRESRCWPRRSRTRRCRCPSTRSRAGTEGTPAPAFDHQFDHQFCGRHRGHASACRKRHNRLRTLWPRARVPGVGGRTHPTRVPGGKGGGCRVSEGGRTEHVPLTKGRAMRRKGACNEEEGEECVTEHVPCRGGRTGGQTDGQTCRGGVGVPSTCR